MNFAYKFFTFDSMNSLFYHQIFTKIPLNILSLYNTDEIDWIDYLDRYPDVKNSHTNPIHHFINYGLYEGRYVNLKPLVTIIITFHNNEVFLDRAINSLVTQTLSRIEILLVDDYSTDESVLISKIWKEKDNRIRLLKNAERKGFFYCRKQAISLAKGKVVLFVDAHGYLSPEAASDILDCIKLDYQAIYFGTRVSGGPLARKRYIALMNDLLNRGKSGSYHGTEILINILYNHHLSRSLFGKAFKLEIAQQAYQLMEAHTPGAADEFYETIFLESLCNSIIKLPKNLYYLYMYDTESLPFILWGQTQKGEPELNFLPSLKKYFDNLSLPHYFAYILEGFCESCIEIWFSMKPSRNTSFYFNLICSTFGIIPTLETLFTNHANDWKKIAERIRHFQLPFNPIRSVKHIGILYLQISEGGAERVVMDLCDLLIKHNFDVTLLLSKSHMNDIKINPKINILYLEQDLYGSDRMFEHLRQLHITALKNKFDLIFSQKGNGWGLLSQIILLHFLDIPVIVFQHSAYYLRLLFPDEKYTQQNNDAVLACADKVLCLSPEAELYLRNRGVDAKYIPNPVKSRRNEILPFQIRKNNILFMGRLGDPLKQVSQALEILAQVVPIFPEIKLIFVGSFIKPEQRAKFYNLVSQLKLQNHIIFTGWLSDTYNILRQCSILLSTSYIESFSLVLVEAQSAGLPCIIYDLPVPPAENNESIISVPQGDVRRAANKIIELLSDQFLYDRLSRIAYKNSLKYSPEQYIKSIISIINNFDKKSDIMPLTPSNFQKIIRSLAFYAMNQPPIQ